MSVHELEEEEMPVLPTFGVKPLVPVGFLGLGGYRAHWPHPYASRPYGPDIVASEETSLRGRCKGCGRARPLCDADPEACEGCDCPIVGTLHPCPDHGLDAFACLDDLTGP